MGCQRSILANTVTPPQPKGVPRSAVAGSDYTELTFARGDTGTAISPISHSYSRDFGNTGKNPDRDTWWNCYDMDKSKSTGINYMETHSIEVDEGSFVNIYIDHIIPSAIQSTHFVALYKGPRAVSDKQAYTRLQWGEQFYPTDAGNNAGGEGITVSNNSPAHFTIIPCDENGQCIPDRVYSLFFVVPLGIPGYLDSFKNVAQVNLSETGWWDAALSDSTWDDKLKDSENPNLFARPQWTYDPTGNGTLTYWGTIIGDRMGTYDSVLIWLNKTADVDVPITTRYFQITDVKTLFTDANTKQPIDESVWNDLVGKRSAFDGVLGSNDYPVIFDLGKFQERAQMKNDAVNQQMVVYGTGRISGAKLVEDDYYPTSADFGSILDHCPGIPESSRVDGNPRLRDVLRLGEYFVRSGLLSLRSNFNDPTAPAIDCFNVQVGWGAKQQHGCIGLNSNWDGDGNTNPHGAAKLFDVKLCGNYMDASDGPDLMAPDSLIQSCYLMTTDDGIKISSDGGKYLDNTLIQGCIGSAVMIGSYGAAGSIESAQVDGVYIHRLCQGEMRDNNGDMSHGLEPTGGMIATRTYPHSGENYHLGGITISGVYVPALGGTDTEGKDPTLGPNCLQRVFAIGSDLPFGSDLPAGVHPGKIGSIQITSSDILCNPMLPSLFHNYLDGFTMAGPFIFSEGNLSDPDDIGQYALKVWPTGAMDGAGWFYTVPGFSGGDSKANGVKAYPDDPLDATGPWTYEPYDADTASSTPEGPWLTGLIQKPYQ